MQDSKWFEVKRSNHDQSNRCDTGNREKECICKRAYIIIFGSIAGKKLCTVQYMKADDAE